MLVKSFVIDDVGPYAIALSALHYHEVAEAWLDVVFGEFDGGSKAERFTFGCRVGPVQNSAEPAATAVDAAVPYEDTATFGHKLSRDEALAHPRLSDFWAVVNFLLVEEPAVNHHLYEHVHKPVQRPKRWWRR